MVDSRPIRHSLTWITVVIATFSLYAPAQAVDAESTHPLHPAWAPVLAPPSLLVPGVSHLARGETETAHSLLAISATTLGLSSYAGLLLLAVGPTHTALAFLAPTLVLASLHAALGTADLIGGFTGEATDSTAADRHVSQSLVQSPFRARGTYLLAPQSASSDRKHAASALLELRSRSFTYDVQTAVALQHLDDFWFGGGIAYRQIRFTDEPRSIDGVHWGVDAAFNQDRAAQTQLFRVNYGVKTYLPLGLLWPRTLSRISTRFSLGVSQFLTKSLASTGSSHGSSSFGLSGGFETRWQCTDDLAFYWGFEHGRLGVVGDGALGLGRTFSLGGEVRVREGRDSDAYFRKEWWLGAWARHNPTLTFATYVEFR